MNGQTIPGYVLNRVIGESYPRVVYHATRSEDQSDVVIKTLADKFPKRENLASIQREFNILSRMGEGVVKSFDIISYGHGNLAIVMEYFGLSLKEYQARFKNDSIPVDEFLPIAKQIVNTIGKVHGRKVIHRDLNPSNILIDPDHGEVKVIDFSSSTEHFHEHHNHLNVTNRIEGSLPYISPEQTGRMNRDVDYRSDFYSLGATFFELLTGQLPFQANDPIEWVHAHISKPAKPVRSVNRDIPAVLSQMILKLMAKNAEDRYQSSFGLSADLQNCIDALRGGSSNFEFELAAQDVSEEFQIPQKLYGRQKEREILEACFANASNGSVEFALVYGYSGTGKTTLVNDLNRSITSRRGYLIHGKFDQFRQNTAYAALSLAFRDLMRQLLGEPAERLEKWKQLILEAVGENARLIVDVLPELELIIGEQPEVQELPPAENQNRFVNVFINFIKVFATDEHPLVVFFDDLQWSDIPSLNLINRLVTTHDLSHLLILGAFRDNEVDTTHPLSMTIRSIRKKRHITEVAVKPLSKEATNELISDALISDFRSKELGEMVYEKTGGNPYFTVEMLKDLKKRDAIYFDADAGRWEWDMDQVRSVDFSDNVVDILVASQSELPESAQHILSLASCIGSEFDLRTLSIISKKDLNETGEELRHCLSKNMVIPMDEGYKFFGLDDLGDPQGRLGMLESLNPSFKFQHDRVQQAAYSMIAKEQREEVHLSIGRLILENSSDSELDDRLLEVVGHINAGKELVKGKQDRTDFARLNLLAATKAKQSSSYEESLKYLETGKEMLGDWLWNEDFQLSWNLCNELQHCAYLTGDLKTADELSAKILQRAKTPLQKGEVLSVLTRQYATTGRMVESIESAYKGLAILGFHFVRDPGKEHVNEEFELVEKNLNGRKISTLINLPEVKDENVKIANQLIMEIFAAAFLSGSGEMFPYLVLKSVNIALTSGNSPESAFAYAAYAMILCGYFEDTAKGFEYGKLAVEMNEHFDDIALRSRILYLYTMFVHHWSNHWSSMTPWFRKVIEAGYQSGDLLYLAYGAQDCIIWDPKLDLQTASEEHRKLLAIVEECDYQDSLDSGTLFLQMQLNFQGLTSDRYSMSDESFDEEACLQGMRERKFMTGIGNYRIYKAEIHLMYNNVKGGIDYVLEQDEHVTSVMALPQMVRFHIVSFLTRSQLLNSVDDTIREEYLSKMHESLAKMRKWSKQCPENFEHLCLLMEAELSNGHTDLKDTLALFDRSIALAHENSYRRDEAMANEFAAKYLLRQGLDKAAEGYLESAHHIYSQWGAHRKVESLQLDYRHLSKATQREVRGATGTRTLGTSAGSSTFSSELLDMDSVLRASQVISGELALDKLLKATLRILIENAGAQKGCLVELQDGNLEIQAFSEMNGENGSESNGMHPAGNANLPASLVNTAIRTKSPIVIANASSANPYSSDEYIKREKPLSIMCIPLPSHGNTKAAVYLENNITHSVFTQERVEVIKLLAGQASISMENARIYEEQRKLVLAQQRFVPTQFLKHLGHEDIARVALGESVGMEMSVLFSDIRDFTQLVEQLTPHEVIELLNRYFSRLGIPINEAGGFIDSYAGDALLALFAIPAQRAVRAGIAMTEELRKFNTKAREDNQPELFMGIGMNTGPLVLGTMGADQRMQCSVLGDTVNLASRIEQLTKRYKAQFLIAENTFNALEDPGEFSLRKVDRVAVKGKGQAVDLYEILDAENEAIRKAKQSTMHYLADAQEAYYSRQFVDAQKILEKAIVKSPEDMVLQIYLQRSFQYAMDPPDASWGGFEKLDHK